MSKFNVPTGGRARPGPKRSVNGILWPEPQSVTQAIADLFTAKLRVKNLRFWHRSATLGAKVRQIRLGAHPNLT